MLQELVTILFVSSHPVSKKQCMSLLSCDETTLNSLVENVREMLVPSGLTIISGEKELALTTAKHMADLVAKITKKELEGDLSPAALQTLTLIAYLPKATKADISLIRGVSSATSIRNLYVRGLIEETALDTYTLTTDALRFLSVTKKEELPEYESVSAALLTKLHDVKQESLS